VAKAAPFICVYIIMINWLKRRITDYSRSPQWSSVRNEHIKNQPICQACLRKKDLEVHHIIPYHIDPNQELNPQNLITLCSDCHLLFGHLMDYKSWNENVVKDCETFSSKVKSRPYNEKYNQNFSGWIPNIFKR